MHRGLFQASKNGDGCGIAIVSLPVENGALLITIQVLPKFWAKGESVHFDLDKVALPGSTVAINIFEGQKFFVVSVHPERLRCFSELLTGLTFSSESTDDDDDDEHPFGRTVRLFTALPTDHGLLSQPESNPSLEPPASFWDLLQDSNNTDLLKIPKSYEKNLDLSTYLSATLMNRVPELKPLHARLLIEQAEPAVLKRRHHFRPSSDLVSAVRGRIDTRDLPNRASSRRQQVLCHFDDMDSNTPWMRLLRVAVRQASQFLADAGHLEHASRGWRIDKHLSEVQLISAARALRDTAHLRFTRTDRNQRTVMLLSQRFLADQFDFGINAEHEESPLAAAAAVRVSTSRLFEKLLGSVALENGGTIRQFQGKINLHSDPVESVSDKKPDLEYVTRSGESMMLIDAKYKHAPDNMNKMPMSDTYQQYGYAMSSGKDTVFLYVSQTDSLKPTWRNAICREDESSVQLGFFSVRFPIGEPVIQWRQETAASLFKALISLHKNSRNTD